MFWRRRTETPAPTLEEELLEDLSAYLDGELSDREAARVEALVARDDSARELLEDLRLLNTAFSTLREVQAPRSFAIPAGQPRATSTTAVGATALFGRLEMLMRASAAVAALLFVVALANDPGGSTPVVGNEPAAMESLSAPSAEMQAPGAQLEPPEGAREEGAGEDAGTMAAPDSEETNDAGDAAGGQDSAAEGAAEGTPSAGEAAAAASEDDPGDGDGATDDSDAGVPPTGPTGEPLRQGDEARALETLQPAGTNFAPDASQGAGGMAPALGTLALLLVALSALLVWHRRRGHSA